MFRRARLTAVMIAAAMVAACGGGDGSSDTEGPNGQDPGATTTTPESAASDSSSGTDTTSDDTSGSDETADSDDTATTEPPEDTSPPPTTPTTIAAPEVAVFDLATLTGLITPLDTELDTADPLQIARQLVGFPVEVGVPEGSTLFRIDATVRTYDDATRTHDLSYSVIAPGGTVPDIDINLDDNGPGSAQIIEIWDPIMTALGYDRSASTGSDPGDPGGPNSVNHVYVPGETVPGYVNGVPADVGNIFIWSFEDVTGATYGSDPTNLLGGYQIDTTADVAASEPFAVPLLQAIADRMPVPDTAELTDGTIRLETRRDDAFEIDRGKHYVSVSLTWTTSTTTDELADFYTDGSLFDGEVLMAAEASFFNEDEYEPAVIGQYGDTDHRLPVLLARQYEGTLWIKSPSDPSDPATITYDVTLNPNDVALTAPAG